MWITERNGRYQYRERYTHPVTGETKTVCVTLDSSTPRARRQAEELLRAKMEVAPESMRLFDLVEVYLEDQKHTVAKNTLQRNTFAMARIKKLLGNVRLDKLTAGYVRKCFMADNDRPSTYNERITRFKALIRWGYRNDYLSDIKWLDKLNRLVDEDKRDKLSEKFYESHELKALLEAMTVPRWRYLAKLTALSGLRIGEAIALTVEDIHKDIINVDKTYDMINGIITDPKTASSVREVYLTPELRDLIKEIRVAMAKQDRETGCHSVYLLHDVTGAPLNYYSFNAYLNDISVKVTGKRASTHIMRHTHVALLAEKGVPLDVISRRLGHKDSKITRDVYFHVTEARKKKDFDVLASVSIL